MHQNQIIVGDGIRKCFECLKNSFGPSIAAGSHHGGRDGKRVDVLIFGTYGDIDAVDFRNVQKCEHGRLQHRLSAITQRQILLGTVGLHARAAAGGGHYNENAAIGVGHSYV